MTTNKRYWLADTKYLRKRISQIGAKTVFVEFLTHAVQYREAWEEFGGQIFVHCHGQDITWDALSQGVPVHSSEYIELVQSMGRSVTFIVNSDFSYRRMAKIGIPCSQIDRKYLGVEVPTQPITDRNTGKRVTILYLGRLVDCKGPDLVLRAFDLACQQGLKGKLVMAGDGPMRLECQSIVEDSRYRNRIEFVGAVDASMGSRLRREADIFTAHSQFGQSSRQEEAFGAAFVEAMGSSLPIVTGRSGSLPEVVGEEDAGILFEPGDIEAHAHALLSLANEPERRIAMGQAGWGRARRLFSVEREKEALYEILFDQKRSEKPSTIRSRPLETGKV